MWCLQDPLYKTKQLKEEVAITLKTMVSIFTKCILVCISGYIRDVTGSYTTPIIVMLGLLAFALLILVLADGLRRRQKRIERQGTTSDRPSLSISNTNTVETQ